MHIKHSSGIIPYCLECIDVCLTLWWQFASWPLMYIEQHVNLCVNCIILHNIMWYVLHLIDPNPNPNPNPKINHLMGESPSLEMPVSPPWPSRDSLHLLPLFGVLLLLSLSAPCPSAVSEYMGQHPTCRDRHYVGALCILYEYAIIEALIIASSSIFTS